MSDDYPAPAPRRARRLPRLALITVVAAFGAVLAAAPANASMTPMPTQLQFLGGLCLNDPGGNGQSNVQLTATTCQGLPGQEWVLYSGSIGTTPYTTLYNPARHVCANNWGGTESNGAPIKTESHCEYYNNMFEIQVAVVYGASYVVYAPYIDPINTTTTDALPRYCIGVAEPGSSGDAVQLWTCGVNQALQFIVTNA